MMNPNFNTIYKAIVDKDNERMLGTDWFKQLHFAFISYFYL